MSLAVSEKHRAGLPAVAMLLAIVMVLLTGCTSMNSLPDTTAILDRWQWDCEGCVPSELDSCGITPQ